MLNLPRNQVQLISFLLFHGGVLILVMGGWHNEMMRSIGISLMAGSIWFVMMSESMFLTKVQNEMQQALDGFSRKRECEIQDLLYFLREMRKGMVPFESLDSTKTMINKVMHHPAIILDVSGTVAEVNEEWCDIFGWAREEIVGKLHLQLHDPDLYTEYAMGIAKQYEQNKNWLWSRMIFKCKDGTFLKASVGIIFLGTKKEPIGTLGIILPDEGGIIEKIDQ